MRRFKKPHESRMTLCLAALAQSNIVIVTDTKVSVDDFGYDGATPKFFPLPTHAALLVADDMGLHSELLDALRDHTHKVRKISIAALADYYRELVNKTYFRRKREDILQRYYGLTSDTYLTTQLHEDQAQAIAEKIESIPPPPIETILVGYDDDGDPHIYKYSKGELRHENLNNFATIGCGWELAEHRLLELQYKKNSPLSHALFCCYDAKRYSEIIDGVGEITSLFYMDEAMNFRGLYPESMSRLEELYQKMKNSVEGVGFKIRMEWYEALKENKNIE